MVFKATSSQSRGLLSLTDMQPAEGLRRTSLKCLYCLDYIIQNQQWTVTDYRHAGTNPLSIHCGTDWQSRQQRKHKLPSMRQEQAVVEYEETSLFVCNCFSVFPDVAALVLQVAALKGRKKNDRNNMITCRTLKCKKYSTGFSALCSTSGAHCVRVATGVKHLPGRVCVAAVHCGVKFHF